MFGLGYHFEKGQIASAGQHNKVSVNRSRIYDLEVVSHCLVLIFDRNLLLGFEGFCVTAFVVSEEPGNVDQLAVVVRGQFDLEFVHLAIDDRRGLVVLLLFLLGFDLKVNCEFVNDSRSLLRMVLVVASAIEISHDILNLNIIVRIEGV